MATKKDVKRLLSKGLTGKEAARLLIQNLVEVDHRRPQILSLAEAGRVKQHVGEHGSPQDIRDFNTWVQAYQIVGFTLKEAHVLALDIQLVLERQQVLVLEYLLFYQLRAYQARRPVIVTEKQYEDLRAGQRERKLRKLYCLNRVICYRMGALAHGDSQRLAFGRYFDFREEHLVGGEVDGMAEWDAAGRRLYKQAAREIQELIDSEALKPQVLERRADDFETAALESNQETWGQYESCLPEGTSEEEEEQQLTTYFSGEQLYQAGLPEWQEEIDTFEPDAEDLPYHGSGIAVLKHPEAWTGQVDKQSGYYALGGDIAEHLSGVPELEERGKEDGRTIKELLQQSHRGLRKRLRVFLAIQPVLEAVSELIGVNLTEDLQVWYGEIVEAVEGYQELLSAGVIQPLEPDVRRSLNQEELERHPELPAFTIDDLRPDPKEIQHLKERMGLVLGEDWEEVYWEWMKGQTERIDAEEDSQAEEVEPCGQDAEG